MFLSSIKKMGTQTIGLVCLLFVAQIGVAANHELIVVRPDGSWPPQEMLVDGELTGFHIEQVQQAARLIDLDVTFKSVPWNRAIEMLKKGDANAITYMAKTREREKFGYFFEDNVLSKATVGFFVLSKYADNIHFSGELSSLQNYTIGSVLGFSYHEGFDQMTTLNKFNSAENESNLIRMLLDERVSVAIGHVDVINYLAKQMGIADQIMFLSPYLTEGREHYLVFAKAQGDDELSKRFAKSMKAFKSTDQYHDLLSKYGLIK